MPRSLWESDKSPITLPTSRKLKGTIPRLGLGLGTADALAKLASVTNGPVRSADVTNKMAKPDQMNRLSAIEVLSAPERNDSVGAVVTLRHRHSVPRKTRSWKAAGSTLDHRRYVKAQVMAARSETAWTPRTTE